MALMALTAGPSALQLLLQTQAQVQTLPKLLVPTHLFLRWQSSGSG
jgi:hypothetical protein